MAGEDEISEQGRKVRFERWEKIGLDWVKHDLLQGGHQVIGGSPAVRELAREWVRIKEAEQAAAAQEKPAEMVTFKPNIHGIGIDLKEVARRIRRRFKKS
jgi:hypothetical protein